jgi:uncharacterized membrane protein YeaQ/YmgE (transglycosylase-associated protein family)
MGLGIIGWIVVGAIAGWIAEKMTSSDHGLLTNIVVGIVGGVIGGFLANALDLQIAGGFVSALIVATIGAVILLFVLRAIKR